VGICPVHVRNDRFAVQQVRPAPERDLRVRMPVATRVPRSSSHVTLATNMSRPSRLLTQLPAHRLIRLTHSFQRNVNTSIIAFVKFCIFFITLLNKAVGRESKDVAGPFADLCGPLMIVCMMVMIAANISLQLQVSSFHRRSSHYRNGFHQNQNTCAGIS
jgi:hypothetical protein